MLRDECIEWKLTFFTWHELFLLSELCVSISAHSNGELRCSEVLHQLTAPHVLTLRDVRQLLDVFLGNKNGKKSYELNTGHSDCLGFEWNVTPILGDFGGRVGIYWIIFECALFFDQLDGGFGSITAFNLINSLNQGFDRGNSLDQKLWTHLDNRGKRGLRSTMVFLLALTILHE